MAILSLIVDVYGGAGGPNDDSIPVYSDNKAPNGGQVRGANGLQLMLENSETSGVQYIIVNPDFLTEEENQGGAFVSYKHDGTPNYVRIWIRNPETGEGDDYAPGVEMWVEFSHLRPSGFEPPTVTKFLISIFSDGSPPTVVLVP